MKKRVRDLAVGDLVLSSSGYTWRVVEVIGWRNLVKQGRGREYLLIVRYSGLEDTALMRRKDIEHEVEVVTEEVTVEEIKRRRRGHYEHIHVTFDPKQVGGEHEVSQP